jgi:TrpR-related protein YerC/YecD
VLIYIRNNFPGGIAMNIKSERMDRLFEIILGLETVEECYAFFTDLCTIKELNDMSKRFEAAIKLNEGANYLDIAADVGLSTATISRVSRSLNYGEGGYQAALERLNNKK